jgi:hypothetical protein
MTKSPETVLSRVVYLGRRWINDKEIVDKYILEGVLQSISDNTGGEAAMCEKVEYYGSLFQPPKSVTSPTIIGAVYEMKCAIGEDTRITNLIVNQRKFIEMSDHPLKVLWQSFDDIAKTKKRTATRMKKLKEHSYLVEDVKRLAIHYQSIPYSDRTAFELVLLHALRRGGL